VRVLRDVGGHRVTSAYFAGKVDSSSSESWISSSPFPLIILALAVVSILGPGIMNVIIAITIPMIPRAAFGRAVERARHPRDCRTSTPRRAAGFRHRRIILRHMLPNVMAPYLIMLTAYLGQAILLEASLSFLGLGVSEPTPAWGLMLRGAAVQSPKRRRGWRSSPVSRSAWPSSPSIFSATRSGMRSTRA